MAASDTDLQVILKIRDMASSALVRFEKNVSGTAARSTASFQRLSTVTAGLRSRIVGLVGAFAGFVAVRRAVSTMIAFEKGLVGVGKTANIQGAALEKLGDQITALAIDMRAIPTTQLLEIAQAAGQLGVTGADNLLRFTETVGKLGSATVLRGEEAAITLARLLNVTNEGVETVDRLGAAIVALGNSFAANEREIALMGTAVAQNTAIFGVSSREALALGTAMAAVGLQTEIAGSSIGRAFRAMDAAIRGQGQKLRALADIMGMTADQASDLFRADTVRAFQMFLVGLNKIVEAGGDVTKTLDQFGLADIRILKVLPVLATRHEDVARALQLSEKEYRANTALNIEYARAADTLGARIQGLANTFNAVITQQRDAKDTLVVLVDTITGAVAIIGGLEDAAINASDASKKLAEAIKLVGKGLIALVAVRAAMVMKSVAVAIGGAAIAMKGFALALIANPIILAASAVAALGGAMLFLSDQGRVGTAGFITMEKEVSNLTRSLNAAAAASKDVKFGITPDIRVSAIEKQLEALRAIAEMGGREQVDVELLAKLVPTIDVDDFLKRWKDQIRFVGKRTKEETAAIGAAVGDEPIGLPIKLVPTIRQGLIQAPVLDQIKALEKQLEVDRARVGTIKAAEGTTAAIDKELASLEKNVVARENQVRVIKEEGVERDILKFKIENHVALSKVDSNVREDLLDRYSQASEGIREEARASEEASAKRTQTIIDLANEKQKRVQGAATVAQMRIALEQEGRMIGLSTAEREIEVRVLQFENALRRAGAKDIEAQTEAMRKQLVEMEKRRPKAGDDGASMLQPEGFAEGFSQVTAQFDTAGKRMAIVGADVASALLDSFTIDFFDPMTGRFRDLGEIGRSVINSLLSAFSQIASRFAAMSVLGGLGITVPGLAKGGTITDGRLIPAAKGLVMSQPTILGIGSGKGVLAAERHRKEAVLPLATTSSGDLGVQAVGGGGGGGDVTFNYAPVIHAPQDTDLAGLDRIMRDSEGRMNNWWLSQMAKGGKVRSSLIRTVRTA
jgi:TP901 family phage tail tape measure protein